MAENSTEKDPSSEGSDTFNDGVERDLTLQVLTESVNRTGLEIGVTLCVGGALVSGIMISGKTYFDGLNSLMSENADNEDVISFFKEIFDAQSSFYDFDHESKWQLTNKGYVHLKDVRFHGTDGSQIPSTAGTLWRGRISQVSGFNLGTFGSG